MDTPIRRKRILKHYTKGGASFRVANYGHRKVKSDNQGMLGVP
jgi:hypothetical protein